MLRSKTSGAPSNNDPNSPTTLLRPRPHAGDHEPPTTQPEPSEPAHSQDQQTPHPSTVGHPNHHHEPQRAPSCTHPQSPTSRHTPHPEQPNAAADPHPHDVTSPPDSHTHPCHTFHSNMHGHHIDTVCAHASVGAGRVRERVLRLEHARGDSPVDPLGGSGCTQLWTTEIPPCLFPCPQVGTTPPTNESRRPTHRVGLTQLSVRGQPTFSRTLPSVRHRPDHTQWPSSESASVNWSPVHRAPHTKPSPQWVRSRARLRPRRHHPRHQLRTRPQPQPMGQPWTPIRAGWGAS